MTGPADDGHPTLALTGATGFVGSTILMRLSAAGWRVRALYRPRRARVLPDVPGVEWVAGDLHDEAALAALVVGASAVIHCAGAVRGARRAGFDRVNEDGSRRIALAASHEAGCERLLLISSLAARAPELSDYAGSKRRGERAVAASAGHVRWTVLRPPAVFGPGDRELQPLFRSMARGFAPLPAGAHGHFSLLYVDDLATAVLRWLAVDAGAGETFELEDGRAGGYDWDTIVRLAGRVLRGASPVRRVPIPIFALKLAAWINLLAARALGYAPMLTPGKVRELTYPDWVGDSTAFARTMDWRPAFGFERGLACTFGKGAAALHGVS